MTNRPEFKQHFLVIDLEATCWDKESVAPAANEIIEIGLAILSPSKEILWNGGWFVRPRVCPTLSQFCKDLTSISQEQVDSAPAFSQAMDLCCAQIKAVTNCAVNDSLFISWGNYDRRQFESDCLLHNYQYPFGQHLNLKKQFMRLFKLKKAGMPTALEILQLDLSGTHHRGADDALNTARIFQKLELNLE